MITVTPIALASSAPLELHRDLLWIDQHAWSPVAATREHTLTGAVIWDVSVKKAGRPITLAAPDAAMAWHPLAAVNQLHAWAALPLQQFLLTIQGQQFTVLFRHDEPPAVEASPVAGFSNGAPEEDWRLKVKFIQI